MAMAMYKFTGIGTPYDALNFVLSDPKYRTNYNYAGVDSAFYEDYVAKYGVKITQFAGSEAKTQSLETVQKIAEMLNNGATAVAHAHKNYVLNAGHYIAKAADNAADAVDSAKDVGKAVENATAVGKNADEFVGAIKSSNIDELPDHVQDIYGKYENHKWNGNISGQSEGTRAGGVFKDKFNDLPSIDSNGSAITYREFNANDRISEQGRGTERVVVGSDGSVYYTDSHYGDTDSLTGISNFVKIE